MWLVKNGDAGVEMQKMLKQDVLCLLTETAILTETWVATVLTERYVHQLFPCPPIRLCHAIVRGRECFWLGLRLGQCRLEFALLSGLGLVGLTLLTNLASAYGRDSGKG